MAPLFKFDFGGCWCDSSHCSLFDIEQLYPTLPHVQQKSAEKLSPGERLKSLRLKRQCNWAEIARDIDLSEAMVYAVIAGKKSLSDKAIYRLEELERASGIINWGGGEQGETIQGETIAPSEITLLRSRAEDAEKKLADLREGLYELLAQSSPNPNMFNPGGRTPPKPRHRDVREK